MTLLLTVAALWAAHSPSRCTMQPEPKRYLNLERTVDREHLTTDLAESERVSRRWAARPGAAGSPGDAESCHATLVRQIMTTHDVTPSQVLAATARPTG